MGGRGGLSGRGRGEEGAVLGLSLSGACGNASSPKYTVGLGFYSLLFYSYLLFSLFLPFLFQPGLNGFGYFSEEGGDRCIGD